MAVTYNVSTPRGLVRLLAVDTVLADAKFQDDEIDAFLTLCGNEVRLAAALALDAKAADVAAVQGVTSVEGITVDGHLAALALRQQADELRRQYHESDDGSSTSPIDWAEWVVDNFSYRDRIIGEWMRQSS